MYEYVSWQTQNQHIFIPNSQKNMAQPNNSRARGSKAPSTGYRSGYRPGPNGSRCTRAWLDVVTLAGRRERGGYSGRRLTTSGLNEKMAIVKEATKKNGKNKEAAAACEQAGQCTCDKNLKIRGLDRQNRIRSRPAGIRKPSAVSFISAMMFVSSRRLLGRQAPSMASRALSSSSLSSLFNPTEEHSALRSMLRSFVEKEVCFVHDMCQ